MRDWLLAGAAGASTEPKFLSLLGLRHTGNWLSKQNQFWVFPATTIAPRSLAMLRLPTATRMPIVERHRAPLLSPFIRRDDE